MTELIWMLYAPKVEEVHLLEDWIVGRVVTDPSNVSGEFAVKVATAVTNSPKWGGHGVGSRILATQDPCAHADLHQQQMTVAATPPGNNLAPTALSEFLDATLPDRTERFVAKHGVLRPEDLDLRDDAPAHVRRYWEDHGGEGVFCTPIAEFMKERKRLYDITFLLNTFDENELDAEEIAQEYFRFPTPEAFIRTELWRALNGAATLDLVGDRLDEFQLCVSTNFVLAGLYAELFRQVLAKAGPLLCARQACRRPFVRGSRQTQIYCSPSCAAVEKTRRARLRKTKSPD